MNHKIKVLLLDGHTIQVLPLAKALRKKNYHVTAFCEEKLSFGWASRYPHEKVLCPSAINETDTYLNFLEKFLKKNRYDVTIPLFNDTAELMSENKKRFSVYTKVAIPDYHILIQGHDKNLTMSIARKLNIPHPRTMDLEKNSLEDAVAYCGLPSLIKPNIAAGARGITRVDSLDELKSIYQEIRTEFGPSTLQEFIPQTGFQFKCQMFRDNDGSLKASTVQKKYRFFPITGGSTSCSEIVDRLEIVEYSKQILDEIKWTGFADFDYIQDPRDNKYKIMEINPRVPACIRSCFESGTDFAEMIVQQALGKNVTSYQSTPGMILRFMSLDILWFLFSSNKERFATKPSWFKFWGNNICYEDGAWDDPLPMFAGFILGIKKYLNPKFRKSKLSFKRKSSNNDLQEYRSCQKV
ncbi:ATP-grasp domain-containing protein [Sulfurovum sp. AR]|uniref:carboxylate--amine ligase n=1 Tax=Sulfurovum sp. AR TaxID=1165841 RepID=UPI00025C4F23|nr:ATP-grasp domain-containing protein [Sulfurovum sp. AR]EIF51170.1 carbamoylphosphate synthase large subunit [Sulfurovum sp. AR]